MNITSFKYNNYLLLLLVVCLPIFINLGIKPIRMWDESRLAINAYEMLKNNNYIITYYEGSPDMWNTKPPMQIWAQVLFMKIFGVNELAIRLPSAFAALLTCISLLFFLIRYLKSFWFGFITVMVLITSSGFIGYHASRTGDYDALLALFTTLSSLLFYIYIDQKKEKYLYLFFLFTALAVLTKSIAGLIFIPALIMFVLIEKKFFRLIKNKHFYFGLVGFLFLVFGYYGLREFYNPGYILAVERNELGGRFLNIVEKHKEPFFYYFKNLVHSRFLFWYTLIPLGIWLGMVHKNDRIKKITLFSVLLISSYLLIISISQTKLPWYDVPLYPFLALIASVFIFHIFTLLRRVGKDIVGLNKMNTFTNYLPYFFLIMIFIGPYQLILEKVFLEKEGNNEKHYYEIGYYLKDIINNKEEFKNFYLMYNRNNKEDYYVMNNSNNMQNNFYVKILQYKGLKISFKDWRFLDEGDCVITNEKKEIRFIQQNYLHKAVQINGNIMKYEIYGRK